MNKIIGLLSFTFMIVAGLFSPQDAEAAKLRIEPSITFRNSHTYARPRPVYVARPREVRHYTYYDSCGPYCEEVHYYSEPYYYPVYPSHTHSWGTDYQIQFNIR
ncbi:hypothetical protein [Estrella lausannensis]|uniref:Uncharacterized protein n=1 Tax=Estrella lausannensis TaxID=483423 RepID=A0A0H5E769_9BACT|nr:hypothetical protein [Estrella lausannensis]CRX39165.1 hypothetical protein ELAC_1840 [Estrella lausannensis]